MITDIYNKVKLYVIMDLLAKTIITPPIITLNSTWLPCNLKSISGEHFVDVHTGAQNVSCNYFQSDY